MYAIISEKPVWIERESSRRKGSSRLTVSETLVLYDALVFRNVSSRSVGKLSSSEAMRCRSRRANAARFAS